MKVFFFTYIDFLLNGAKSTKIITIFSITIINVNKEKIWVITPQDYSQFRNKKKKKINK